MSEDLNVSADEIKGLDKLPPQRKFVAEQVMDNLKTEGRIWKPGWKMPEAPESAANGRRYNGVNKFYLSVVAMSRGYADNRWVTYKQMEERGWKFKTDVDGNSLGKGAGVPVEYFMEYDKKTKKRFDDNLLAGMTKDEKDEYRDKNVVWVTRYYYVFNGDVIDGIPEKERLNEDESGLNMRAENLIEFWDKNEVPIIYGGNGAYYSIKNDEIHIPSKELFDNSAERQGTTLHEIVHSTGNEKRLNRGLTGTFGSEDYAKEELVAEFGAMFLMQEMGVAAENDKFENNSAYIQNWVENIKDKPSELFNAIYKADKATQYILAKEKEKSVEPYAVIETENDYGDKVYNLYMIGSYGNVEKFMGYNFPTREELFAEFDKMKNLPFYGGKTFVETTLEDLKEKSTERAETERRREEEKINLDDIKEEESDVFKAPSAAAKALPVKSKPVNMRERGVQTLMRMSDREVVERAKQTKDGNKFMSLYGGISLADTEEKNEQMLMNRIAMFCDGDKGQLLRVFRSSGQYHDEKPNAYYDIMADKSIGLIAKITTRQMPQTKTPTGIAPQRVNANFRV